MRTLAFRSVYALTWRALVARRWFARRINGGGVVAEMLCYVPWLLVTGVGVAGLRVSEALV